MAGGRARKFDHGRIFWSSTTGAHEVYKKVLKAYLRRGGAAGKLGFPLTSPHKVGPSEAGDLRARHADRAPQGQGARHLALTRLVGARA